MFRAFALLDFCFANLAATKRTAAKGGSGSTRDFTGFAGNRRRAANSGSTSSGNESIVGHRRRG